MRETDRPEDPQGPAGIPRLVRRLLANRGLADATEIDRYLAPSLDQLHDPQLLPDLDVAVDRIDRSLVATDPIFIFGDYDVDGITAAVLLRRYLAQLGGRLRVRIPDRLTEGYGLSTKVVDEARAWGSRLIVTADCGTTAHREIAYAREQGLDVIVADHHIPESETPPATALVNPWLPASRYPFPDLCAVGVVTKLVEGLWRRRSERDPATPSPFSFLDLTALGTIADGVTIVDENRLLVRQGLDILRTAPRPSIAALMEAAGLDRRTLGSTDVAYLLVPRLNAAGRLGDAAATLDLLLTDDMDRCRKLASVLDRHNLTRRELLDRVLSDATEKALADGAASREEPLVLGSDRWHAGVVGIAAARLAERFGVPVILLSRNGPVLRGSGRTAGGWDLLDLVRESSTSLSTFGGHRAAIGLSLLAAELDRFRSDLVAAARSRPEPMRREEKVLPIDARAALNELDRVLLGWLDRLQPFGPGNEEPVLAFRARTVGNVRVLKDKHLRFDVTDGRCRQECIGFGMAEWAPVLEATDGEFHLAGVASRNTFRGMERLQLQVKGISLDDPYGNG